MKASRRSDSTDALLDPAAWRGVANEKVTMMASTLALQPSEYVQNKWKTLTHGELKELGVAAAHNDEGLFFRLEWQDATNDGHPNDMADFPDQAGVMLPLSSDGIIEQMGDPAQPVNMWLWRADIETPHYVTAEGRGTTTRHADSPLRARAAWSDGRWALVIMRPFNVSLPAKFVVPLAPGVTHKCTFAVWQGSNKERGGLKAYGPVWQPLEIEK